MWVCVVVTGGRVMVTWLCASVPTWVASESSLAGSSGVSDVCGGGVRGAPACALCGGGRGRCMGRLGGLVLLARLVYTVLLLGGCHLCTRPVGTPAERGGVGVVASVGAGAGAESVPGVGIWVGAVVGYV